MANAPPNRADRIFSKAEQEAFFNLGRFKTLYGEREGHFMTETRGLALECMHDKLEANIEAMSEYIAELEINAGLAKFAGSTTHTTEE